MVVEYIARGSEEVRSEAVRIGQYAPGETVESARELAGRIFCTAYMGTVNSSSETRSRYCVV